MVKNRKNKISARGQLSNVPETFQIGSGVGLFSDGIRYYMQQLLDELNSESALQVNLRLNESETFELSPVFIDWVGTSQVLKALNQQNLLKDDPGRSRFGDGIPSKVYVEAIKAVGSNSIERDWRNPKTLKEKNANSKLLAPKAGAVYQKFIGIVACDKNHNECRVGTITVGFAEKPSGSNLENVERTLRRWASWKSKSDFCQYIETHLILGGPRLS